MRIITVLDSYPPDLNGGAYFTHRLALGLKNKGHDVLVICPSRSLHQGYSDYEGVTLFGVRSWPVFIYKHFRICWPICIKKKIVETIQHFKPDVVHLQGKFFLGGISYRACKKMGIPLMATNHFMPENFFHYSHLPKSCTQWFNTKCWSIVIEMLSNVDTVTTPTQAAADLLRQQQLKRDIQVISCGVDLEKFHPKHNAEFLRQRFKIPNKPILLYSGRIDKEKNIDITLRALAQARQTMDIHLVIAGRGAEQAKLQRLITALGIEPHVTFTGYLSDEEYPKIHGLAACFVQAGTAELQSIVVLEAIASGLPILGARAMALPELITPGANGYLFNPGDVDSLATSMIAVLSNPELKQQMGQESRRVAEAHDIAKTVSHYEQLYEVIINQRTSASPTR